MIWVDYLALIFGIALTVLVAMQNGKDDIQDALSGERSELFKNQKARGFEFVLMVSTIVCSVIFFGLVILSGTNVCR